MKFRLMVLLAVAVLASVPSAVAASFTYSSLHGAQISFSGAGTFGFVRTGPYDFNNVIGSNPALATDLVGGIFTGTYSIGPVTILGGLQTAPVTGVGSIQLTDTDGNKLQGDLEWKEIATFGALGGTNGNAVINVTGMTYSGTKTSFQELLSQGILTLTFQFQIPRPLTYLKSNPAATSYSGSYEQVAIPEPSTLLLLGGGLLALGSISLRSRKGR